MPHPDARYPVLSDETLPAAVRDLSHASNRAVLDPARLFFRKSGKTFSVPSLSRPDTGHWRGSLNLEHRIFYLHQTDGSLAVYAYLFDGSSPAGRSYGCLYVGHVPPEDWTLGGAPC